MKEKPLQFSKRLRLSFLLILLIPVLISIILYFFVVRQTNEQSDRLHDSLLAKVQADMDARFLSARGVGSRLYIDSDVRSLSSVSGEMQREHAMAQVRLFVELSNLALSNETLGDLFIYFPQTHKVISTHGNMDFSMFYSLYYDNADCLSENELDELLTEDHHYDIHTIRAKGGNDQMVMLLTLPSNNGNRVSAAIGMIFSAGMLRKQTTLNEFSDTETRLYLSAASDELYDPVTGRVVTEKLPNDESGSATVRFRGETVRTAVRTSSQTNILYLMLTPERLIHEDVRKMHFVIVMGLILSIICGIFLSGRLTVRNSNPVDRLLKTIRSSTREKNAVTGEDELVWANREVEQLYRNSINNEQLLRDSRRQMRDYCMIQLLTKGHVERPELYGIRLNSASFGIVILKVLEAVELNETELALRTSILGNLFKEDIGKRYPVEILEWGDAAIALISLPDRQDVHLSLIREVSEEVQAKVEGSLHFSCAVFIGPMADGVPEISAAYRNAQDLEEYRALLNADLISSSEIASLETRYDFSMDDEEKLKNAVSIGDEETAGAVMTDVFDRNRRAKIGVDLYWCLVYTMAGVMLRGANNGGIRNAAEILNLPAALTNRKPGNDMENAFRDILKEICCEISRSKSDTEGDRAFCTELETFIGKHFSDPDLNISYVSQQFDLTPAYLSTRYKRETGRSLLEFINTARLDHAEEQLRNGATVAEAAEHSGFRDSGSLIRAFKKKKGITPGQVRQQNG